MVCCPSSLLYGCRPEPRNYWFGYEPSMSGYLSLRKIEGTTKPAKYAAFDTFRRSASSLLCVVLSAAAEKLLVWL